MIPKKALLGPKHLVLIAGLIAVSWTLHFGLTYALGYPSVIDASDPRVNQGLVASGALAWKHVEKICTAPHPYYSDENVRVRKYIVNEMANLKNAYDTWNCANPNPFEIIEKDLINVSFVRAKSRGRNFFESDNVLVRVRSSNTAKGALLVSAHFDSAVTGPGVTDDGLGIGAMLSAANSIGRYACSNRIEHDLILNFNNGEELGTMGAFGFTAHPWFADVSAFINIALVFLAKIVASCIDPRADLGPEDSCHRPPIHTRLFSLDWPCISFEGINGIKHSYTDYSVYVKNGGKVGVDFAFYERRYLYHTERDDLLHSSPESAQHVTGNMYASVLSVLTDKDYLLSLESDLSTEEMASRNPLVSGSYFDILGTISIVNTPLSDILMSATAIALNLVATVWILKRSHVKYPIKNSLYALAIVFSTFVVGQIVAVGLSFLQFKINPAATYGYPELVVYSLLALHCLVMSLFGWFWQTSSPLTLEHGSPSVFSKRLEDDIPLKLSPDFLQLGILLFWSLFLTLGLVASLLGYSALYFVIPLGFFSFLAQITMVLVKSYVDAEKPIQKYMWLAELLISSIIPWSFVWNVVQILLVGIPSLIIEGVPDYLVGAVFSFFIGLIFVNLIPYVIRLRSSLWFSALIVYLALSVPLYMVFPYSPERPYKPVILESLDLESGKSQVEFISENLPELKQILSPFGSELKETTDSVIYSSERPRFPGNNSVSDWIQMNYTMVENENRMFQGVLIGAPSSRSCSIQFSSAPVKMEIDSPGRWIEQSPENMSENRTTIWRRDLPSSNQMQVPFNISFPMSVAEVGMNVSCKYNPYQYSGFLATFLSKKADYVLPDYWEVSLAKSFQLM